MMHRLKIYILIVVLMPFVLSLAGCAARPANGMDIKCIKGLKVAYRELNFAEAKGFSGTVAWSKAASLLTAAKVQQQFEKWPNCVNKVERARYYIKQSQIQ